MMEILRLLSAILATVLIGYSVLLSVLRGREGYTLSEKTALSFGLGIGLVAFEMILFSILGLGFNLAFMVLFWIPFFIYALYVTVRQTGSAPEEKSGPSAFEGSWVYKIIFFIMSLQIVSIFLRALSKPLESYDGIINFGIKAKIFLASNAVPLIPEAFEGIGLGHMDYPVLIPLAETWIFKFIGAYNDQLVKIIFPLIFVAFIVTFYHATRRFYNRRYALLFSFFLCTVPQVVNFATIGYADLTFTFFVTMSFIFLFRYFTEGDNSCLILAALLSGFSFLTKNEAISFAFANLVVIAIFILRQKSKLSQIKRVVGCYVIPLVIVTAGWIFLKGKLGFVNTDMDITALTMKRLGENLSYIPFLLNKFQQGVFGPKKWNILWILVFSGIILRHRRFREFPGKLIGIFMLVNVFIYFTAYMVHVGSNSYFHIDTTLSRFMIHFSGVATFMTAYLFWEDLKEMAFFKERENE